MKVLEAYETSNTGSETDHFKFWDDSNTGKCIVVVFVCLCVVCICVCVYILYGDPRITR